MKKHSSFISVVIENVIVVEEDCDNVISITNDAEWVTWQVVRYHGNLPIVYCDSMGKYDELCHNNGYFTDFQYIGAHTANDAVGTVNKRIRAQIAKCL